MTQFHRVTDSVPLRLVTPRRRMILGVFLVLFAALILSFAAVGSPSVRSSTKVTQQRASASASSEGVTADQSESDSVFPEAPAGHPELLLQLD